MDGRLLELHGKSLVFLSRSTAVVMAWIIDLISDHRAQGYGLIGSRLVLGPRHFTGHRVIFVMHTNRVPKDKCELGLKHKHN